MTSRVTSVTQSDLTDGTDPYGVDPAGTVRHIAVPGGCFPAVSNSGPMRQSGPPPTAPRGGVWVAAESGAVVASGETDQSRRTRTSQAGSSTTVPISRPSASACTSVTVPR